MTMANLYQMNLVGLARLTTLDLGDYFLRPLEIGDLLDYHELTSNDEALQYDYPAHKDLEESLQMLVKWNLASPIGRYGIVNKQVNKLIGNISLTLSENGEVCTIGYAVNYNYWRQGIASFCVAQLLQVATNYLTIKEFQAKVHQGNTGGIKLLEKLGFKKVGEEETSSLRYDHFIELTYCKPINN